MGSSNWRPMESSDSDDHEEADFREIHSSQEAGHWALFIENHKTQTHDLFDDVFDVAGSDNSDEPEDSLSNSVLSDGSSISDQSSLTFNQRPLKQHVEAASSTNLVTVYSSTSRREHEALEVPLQRAFTGPRQVLRSDVASLPSSELSPNRLLNLMNSYLETSYALSQTRNSLLRTSLHHSADFGVAYSLLRPRWHMQPQHALDDIRACCANDHIARTNAVNGKNIVEKNVGPRRVWDLWSNRVVPLWMICPELDHDAHTTQLRERGFFAVSHAWLADDERQTVRTPINGYEWPVPIPANTALERIRTELLHHRDIQSKDMSWDQRYESRLQSYCWLDVLCLRQKGADRDEPLRKEEWKLDIPTIGAIYVAASSVVYYYSGLGLPFRIGNLNHPRHWLNRAWTLQEIKADTRSFIAGLSPYSPPMPYAHAPAPITNPSVLAFCDKMNNLPRGVDKDLFWVIAEMRRRSSVSEIDKIAGLNYLCSVGLRGPLPVYDVDEQPKDAWWRFVEALPPDNRAMMFFAFPEPGRYDGPAWCPSWKQVNDQDMYSDREDPSSPVRFDRRCGEYYFSDQCVDCYISGFRYVGSGSREGYVSMSNGVKGHSGLTFGALADHDQILYDGYYTLLVSGPLEEEHTTIRVVVGRITRRLGRSQSSML